MLNLVRAHRTTDGGGSGIEWGHLLATDVYRGAGAAGHKLYVHCVVLFRDDGEVTNDLFLKTGCGGGDAVVIRC